MGFLAMPPAMIEPEIIDMGAPDIFASGWLMNFGPEIITGTSYVERMECGVIRRYVACRVHYPRSAWMKALDTTLVGVKAGLGH